MHEQIEHTHIYKIVCIFPLRLCLPPLPAIQLQRSSVSVRYCVNYKLFYKKNMNCIVPRHQNEWQNKKKNENCYYFALESRELKRKLHLKKNKKKLPFLFKRSRYSYLMHKKMPFISESVSGKVSLAIFSFPAIFHTKTKKERNENN